MVFGPLRILSVVVLILAIVAPIPVTQAGSTAVGHVLTVVFESVYEYAVAHQEPSVVQTPIRTEILRLKVMMNETRNVPLPVQLSSLLVVTPEIAAAVLNGMGLTLTGLRVGETMLIGFDGSRRFTFLIAVYGRTYANTHQNIAPEEAAAALNFNGFSGAYAITYTAPFDGGPTLLRQTFDFQRKLENGRTFRFSSDAFKFMGQNSQFQSRLSTFGVGLSRMSLGIDGPEGSIDVLDSQVNISPLSFNGSTIRGLHIVSNSISRLRGIEFFAGQARPSLSLLDMSQGRVMGVVVPIIQRESGRVRAGMFYASPGRDNKLGEGGTVWHLDGRYSRNEKLVADGEVAFANGGLSWRGRLDVIVGPLTGYGELLRLDRRSPLISIGVQGGGRETEAIAFQWRGSDRFNASFSYNHTAVIPPTTALSAALDRSTLSASLNYRLSQNSRLNLQFVQQSIETGAPVGGPRFRLETRTLSVSHDLHLNKSWNNTFNARFNRSREPLANAGTESGIIINEQLRYSFEQGSATAFVNYANQKQSLAGLIVRNPGLLPPLLQEAFATDPSEFLALNRDSLDLLLPGVELPQTSGLDVGIRLQKAFSRINLSGEVRHSTNEFLRGNQRNVVGSANVNLRLDAANSLQVSGSRSFGFNSSPGQTTLTISYVHRFGAGSGGGLQFSQLLGLDRGHVQGRVFFDLNGNGQDEPNEPGIPGMKIQIEGDSVISNESGRFSLDVNSGRFQIKLMSEELGVRWRASTSTEQNGYLPARKTVIISFGVTNYGSLAGRVFNDVSQYGERTARNLPGVPDVRVTLRPTNGTGPTLNQIADGSGGYGFRNLSPGTYTVEIDLATLPSDFRIPTQTSWSVTVNPLQNSYQDIPLSAQRAAMGVVFIDKDGDSKFDPLKDQTIEGARVSCGKIEALTSKGGAYILRNLPAGTLELRARTSSGAESAVIRIEIGEGPSRRKAINLSISQ